MPVDTEALEPTLGVEETPLTTETPAAPEGEAPSAPVDETAITEPAASLSTRPRGPDGRFIKADGTQASEAEHAAIEAAATTSPPSPITQPPASAPPSGQPFVVRGDGQKVPMPGSTLDDKGDLRVSAEHVPTYRQLIAEAIAHRGSWRTKEQDYQRQIQEAGAVQQAKAQKYNEASVFMFDIISDPAKLQALVENPERIELVRERLALMLERHDVKAPQPRVTTQDPVVQQEQLETAARSALDEEMELLLDGPQARTLYTSPDDRKALLARYQRRLAAYFTEHEGEIVLDRQVLREDFEEELKVRRDARLAASKATDAAAFNARRNAPPVAAPPVVSPKGPGSTGQTGGKKYESRDDWRKSMGMD